MNFLKIDALIVGGGVGGEAVALALLEADYRVLLTEETDWLGGQLSSWSVPADEPIWIEQHGAAACYSAYGKPVRRYYQQNYLLIETAGQHLFLNPENARISPIPHEPRVSQFLIEEMLSPCLAAGSDLKGS